MIKETIINQSNNRVVAGRRVTGGDVPRTNETEVLERFLKSLDKNSRVFKAVNDSMEKEFIADGSKVTAAVDVFKACASKIRRDNLIHLIEKCLDNKDQLDLQKFYTCAKVIIASGINNDSKRKAMNEILSKSLQGINICYRETITPEDLVSKFSDLPIKLIDLVEEKANGGKVEDEDSKLERYIKEFLDSSFPKTKNLKERRDVGKVLKRFFKDDQVVKYFKNEINPLFNMSEREFKKELNGKLDSFKVLFGNVLEVTSLDINFSRTLTNEDIALYCSNNLPSNFVTLEQEEEKQKVLDNFAWNFSTDFNVALGLNNNSQIIDDLKKSILSNLTPETFAITQRGIINKFIDNVVELSEFSIPQDPLSAKYIDKLFKNVSSIAYYKKKNEVIITGVSSYIDSFMECVNKYKAGRYDESRNLSEALKGFLNESNYAMFLLRSMGSQIEYLSIGEKFKHLIINEKSDRNYDLLDGEVDLEYKLKGPYKPKWVEIKSSLMGVLKSLGLNNNGMIEDNGGFTPQGVKLIDMAIGYKGIDFYYVMPNRVLSQKIIDGVKEVFLRTINSKKSNDDIFRFIQGIRGIFE